MIIRRETKQRQMVLQAVQARKDHPTADQIFNDVHKLDPKISHGTVYYHMFCVKCKKVSDAPHPYKPCLDEEIARQSGYKIIRHRLIFEGVCPECQSKEIRPLTEPVFVHCPVKPAPQMPVPAFAEVKKPNRRK